MGAEILTHLLEAPFFLVTTLITCFLYFALRSNYVYLIDFACYLPADNLRVTISNFIEHLHLGAAMITNKFGLRSNIKSFSLSGMGCSAGLLSISLAKDLLKVHKNSLALVLSMEAQDDEDGFVGVSLSRSLLHVAGNALRTNISELGPLVLPYLEQLRYGWGVVHRKLWVAAGKRETHVPNFKKAFEHFCIHAGGRAVIDAVESNLKLQKEDGEASRMMLYRFGNTSSSSVWYELCYLEAKGAVKKGDRIWQIAFGSGFKCNSAVWKSISAPNPEERNAWSDRIHLYPVQTPIAP
ncbi:hypothetical protein NC652_002247 [Populus alba x Populus x berolinensis]|nr:hypothetical protein NC652_002247 [Populus alba x Populus x berolinensis]